MLGCLNCGLKTVYFGCHSTLGMLGSGHVVMIYRNFYANLYFFEDDCTYFILLGIEPI